MKAANWISVAGACFFAGVFLIGCGTSPSTQNTTGSKQVLIGDPAKGQQLFQQNCASCHSTGTETIFGPGLKGLFSKSSLPNGQTVTVANVEAWIQTGGGNMPSFAQLSDQDRADLVAYLKTLKMRRRIWRYFNAMEAVFDGCCVRGHRSLLGVVQGLQHLL
ncbi:MAG: cytochrome c [Alicyclobacillus sp.]|nr:cytochrome c [Alicyclobacillus sp.]